MKYLTTVYERVSYGLSDTASNLVFQIFTTYLLFFYTDIYGLDAAQVGTLFLVARFADMLESLFVGVLIDHTHTRWGKSRPYFLWFAFPFAIFAILTFITPDFSQNGKLIWAYVTYLGLGFLYTTVNLPITSILPSLSDNPDEITLLGIYRQFLGSLSQVIVAVVTLPLVGFFGQGNQQLGFLLTIVLFAILAVFMLLNTFFNVRERVQVKTSKLSFKGTVRMLRRHQPWWILSTLIFLYWLSTAIRSQTTIYFFKYNLNREGLVPVVNLFTAAALLAILMIPALAKRIGKKQTMSIGLVFAFFSQVILIFGAQTKSLWLIFAATFLNSIGTGLIIGLVSIMLADTITYGREKLGVDAPGLLSSSSSFGVNFGMGVGGLITAMTLESAGYHANTHASAAVLKTITLNYVWLPLLLYGIMWGLLHFYHLTETKHEIK